MMLEAVKPMPKERMDIRERTLMWRGALGLTQRQLGERAGMTQHYIAQIERGAVTNPTLNTIEMITDGLDIDLQQFLFGDPNYPRIPDYSDGYAQAVLDIRDFILYKEPELMKQVQGRDKDRKLMIGLTCKLLLDPEALRNFKKFRHKAKYRVYDDGTVAEIL